MNFAMIAKSDGYSTTWPEYKVKKMANAVRSGGKLWRERVGETNSDDYDPMGDNLSTFAVEDMAE